MAKTIEELEDKILSGDFDEYTLNEYNSTIRLDQRKRDIEKAWSLFEKYATYIHPRKQREVCIMTKYKFIEAMEEEQ